MSVTTGRDTRPVTVIRPGSGWAALNLRELWQFRDLLVTLGIRDVTLRYRQTALGVIWVVLQPLMAAGIFTFIFGRIAKLGSNGIPYFVFSFAGQLGWNVFSSTFTKSSACLLGNAQLVQKVYFPRMTLPLSTVLSSLIDFGVGLVMMAILLIGYHVSPHAGALLFLPVWVILSLMFSVGIGMIAAALTVSYRDVQYVMPVVTQFAMYASPVGYALSALKKVTGLEREIYLMNPLVGLMEGFRWSLLGLKEMEWGLVGYSAVCAFVMLILGMIAFKRMERKFADVI